MLSLQDKMNTKPKPSHVRKLFHDENENSVKKITKKKSFANCDKKVVTVKSNCEIKLTSEKEKGKRKSYSMSEDNKIKKWIIENDQLTNINSNIMWKSLEASGEIPERSFISMKKRFMRHILPKIDTLSHVNKEYEKITPTK